MSEHPDLNTRAEIEKLAALTHLDVAELQPLAEGGAENLRALRRRINQRIFDESRDKFRALEKFTRLLPKGMIAKLAQNSLGPMLSGRVVGEMDPIRAFKIAKRLPASFLADAVPEAEPVKVREIIPYMPAALIRDVALILVEREDYILMGRFADALSAPAIRAVVGAVEDDAVLLKIAFYMEEKKQLTKVVHMIDNDRVARLIRTGTEKTLWPQALSVIDNVDADLRGRLANIMVEQDEATLNDLVGVAHEQNLWGPVLRALDKVNVKHHRKIVNLPAVKDETILGGLVASAYEEGLLEAALPLVRPMREEGRKVVAHAALKQGAEVAEAAFWAAQNTGQWDLILELAEHLDDAERDMIAGLPILRKPQVLRDVLAAGAADNKIALLLDFIERLDTEGQRAAAQVAIENDGDLLEAIIDVTRKVNRWETLAIALAALDESGQREAGAVYRRQTEADRSAFAAAAKEKGVWNELVSALEGEAA